MSTSVHRETAAFRTPESLGTILSVWAHPDDETYLAGGVMAAAAANGQRVVCVSASAGEHGTDDPVGWPPERLGAVRRREAADALAGLGVTEHVWLDYPDGGLATLPAAGPQRRIAELIEAVRPDTILTFGPDGMTFHPDHIEVGRWTTNAWQATGCAARLLYTVWAEQHFADWGSLFEDAGVYMSDQRPDPVASDALEIHLVLDSPALARKVTALRAMPSQTDGFIEAVGEETFRAAVDTEAFVRATLDPDR